MEQKDDLFNRLTEIMNLNDDLNEKNRKMEYMLSFHDQSKDKGSNLNSYSQGINLDYLTRDNIPEQNEDVKPEKNPDNYTINMKVNLKKPIGSYGMNRNTDKRRKHLMEISETIHQKPLSKV